MNQIDRKDLKIIQNLDMNCRLPIRQLAKNIQVQREVAEYRIKRLTKRGIITGGHPVFDLDVIGYRSFRLLLRLFNLGTKKRDELIQYFVSHQHTWWVAWVGGKWDMILNFVCKDSAEFNRIFEEILA